VEGQLHVGRICGKKSMKEVQQQGGSELTKIAVKDLVKVSGGPNGHSASRTCPGITRAKRQPSIKN
jgi:hypothetical protein